MNVDVCTLTLLVGLIAGAIFYLHGWGPSPGIRGLENRPGARGVTLVGATGGVVFLLDWFLYRTPNHAYFSSYLLGLAIGWLALLGLSAVLYILWGLGRARAGHSAYSRLVLGRGEGGLRGISRVSHLILEALALAAPEQAIARPVAEPVEPATPAGNNGDAADSLFAMQERLKRENPEAYLDFERLRLEGAQRDLELQRGNLERLWQEFGRVRTQPEKAAAEVIAQKQQVIAALQEELAKTRRFYDQDSEKLQAALAEYDRLLAGHEQVRDEVQALVLELENGQPVRDDLVRIVTYQKIGHHAGSGMKLGRLAVGEGQITIHHAELTSVRADVIVSSDNNYLTMSDGVARKIRDRGGEEIYRETRKLIPLRRGDIAITDAGELSARKIFHAVVLDFDERQGPTEEVIRELVRNAMHKARELKFQRIAFPVLGAGSGGFPAVAAFRTMLHQLAEEMLRGENAVTEAIVCLSGQFAEIVDVGRALEEIEMVGRVE
ncbi:MAG: macro domain-containing protein [Candidatus Eisenbacteria bacterium]